MLLAAAVLVPRAPAASVGGVLIVFEPYELGERATGTLTLKTACGLMRIRPRGHRIDTIPRHVAVEMPTAASPGQPLQIHFAATDNDCQRGLRRPRRFRFRLA